MDPKKREPETTEDTAIQANADSQKLTDHCSTTSRSGIDPVTKHKPAQTSTKDASQTNGRIPTQLRESRAVFAVKGTDSRSGYVPNMPADMRYRPQLRGGGDDMDERCRPTGDCFCGDGTHGCLCGCLPSRCC